ncbi:hypothetical protein VTP01DRAFT_5590 [Rhizomucor pusillus]|uniref:uncharacterized protein n=1 Tax=Rhizomucor pusillus TaxID=4840 RepID=UPI0037432CBE
MADPDQLASCPLPHQLDAQFMTKALQVHVSFLRSGARIGTQGVSQYVFFQPDRIMAVVEISSTTTLQVQMTNDAGLRRNNMAIPTRNNLSSLFQLFLVFKSTTQQIRHCIVRDNIRKAKVIIGKNEATSCHQRNQEWAQRSIRQTTHLDYQKFANSLNLPKREINESFRHPLHFLSEGNRA